MKVREGGRVVKVAVMVATGVNADGYREILGIHVATTESGAGWLSFFRDLVARGLTGVALVTSDAHTGLVEAIGATLPGAAWQRCRTHYAANLIGVTPKSSWGWVKALLHSVYDQPDATSVHAATGTRKGVSAAASSRTSGYIIFPAGSPETGTPQLGVGPRSPVPATGSVSGPRAARRSRRPSTRADAVVTVRLGHPVRQARLGDPKISGNPLQLPTWLTVPRDPDHVITELSRAGLRHGVHPSSGTLRHRRSDVTYRCSCPVCQPRQLWFKES